MTGMSDLERLVELQAIYELKARRDHAVDQKDWDTYARLHTDDYVAMSIGSEPIVGGRAAADQLAVQMAGVTTVHHCHTPVIEFQDRTNATGVWAMEDNLFWYRNGERHGCAVSASTTKPTSGARTASGASATASWCAPTRKPRRARGASPSTKRARTP